MKQVEWEDWGKRDPYYGVLSGPRQRRAVLTEAELDKFFETGVRHVQYVLEHVSRYIPDLSRGKVLDFGCGVGRLVIPFAQYFQEVYGVDISDGMLNEATKCLKERTIQNASLVRSDGFTFEGISSDIDLVHSFIVFQHIAPENGYQIIDRLLSLVKEGGGVAFHLIVHREAGRFRKFVNVMRRFRPVHILVNAVTGRPLFEPIMQMNTYSLNRIARSMAARGFGPMIAERYGEYLGYESFFIFGQRQRIQ